MKIGVLALQGDFKEHIEMLKKCNVDAKEIRLPSELKDVDGLVIPGGESTTIGKLLNSSGLHDEIIKKYNEGMPIYGTCAGTILLAKNIEKSDQPRLGLLDVNVIRNDYGRQINSFEAPLDLRRIGKFNGIFIRAPVISRLNNGVEILGKEGKNPVLIRQDNILASTFHPELTDDARIHKYFVEMVKKSL